ncbi:MAG: hypothetical protein AB7O48_10170 [Cyclobacteriaceae bacterium]
MDFLKVPVNAQFKSYKDLRLYCSYLDFKAQNPEGIYKVFIRKNKDYVSRNFKKMQRRGWASKNRDGTISLRAYQYVWRTLGIHQIKVNGRFKFKYYKIWIDSLSMDRKSYLKELERIIQKKIAERKAAQMRFRRLENKGQLSEVTFGSIRAANLFGYKSASSGSKLREKYFSLIPQTEQEKKQYWNPSKGMYQNHCRKIAL